MRQTWSLRASDCAEQFLPHLWQVFCGLLVCPAEGANNLLLSAGDRNILHSFVPAAIFVVEGPWDRSGGEEEISFCRSDQSRVFFEREWGVAFFLSLEVWLICLKRFFRITPNSIPNLSPKLTVKNGWDNTFIAEIRLGVIKESLGRIDVNVFQRAPTKVLTWMANSGD